MTFYQWILCFFIYGCTGWFVEELFYAASTRKIVSRGVLYGPICPIYGAGALAIVLFCRPFAHSPALLFLMGVVLTTVLEYITSYLLERFFHTHYWDYTGFVMNIKGRVCIPFSLAWGFLTIILVMAVHPAVSHVVIQTTSDEAMLAATALCFAFVLDILLTVTKTLSIRSLCEKLEKNALFFRVCDLFPRMEQPVDTKEDSRFIRMLQHKYAEIVARREWNNFVTQQISTAFPFLTSEKFHETTTDLKERIFRMMGR